MNSRLTKVKKEDPDMSMFVKLSKRTRDINLQKGVWLHNSSKVTKKHTKDAEYIINEQSDIINAYHKQMKVLLDRTQALEREASYFKKEVNKTSSGLELSDFQSKSIDLTTDKQPFTQKTPGKHSKNSRSIIV